MLGQPYPCHLRLANDFANQVDLRAKGLT